MSPMQFCRPHWTRLKSAIRERGLNDLIARDGHEAAERSLSTAEQDFEPLLAAHNKIIENAMKIHGIAVMAYDGCPLCYLIDHCDCNSPEDQCRADYERWIDLAADGALIRARELHLVP